MPTDGEKAKKAKPQLLAPLLFRLYTDLTNIAQQNRSGAAATVRECWYQACGISDERSLLRTLDTIHEALDRLEVGVLASQDLPKLARSHVKELISGMRSWLEIKNMNSSGPNLLNKMPVASLGYLHFIEAGLENSAPEFNLQETGLQSITEKLLELEQAVDDPNIPDRLRAMLKNLVSRVRWAVQFYDVVGVSGLYREVAAAQITLMHIATLDGTVGPTDQPTWFRRTLDALKSINNTVRLALAVHKTAGAVIEVARDHGLLK